MKKVHEVFGISNSILQDSYVDRGHLDTKVAGQLDRPQHVALTGASKCGKSWLRQRVLPDAITVQCRLGMSVTDIYVDALSQLDVSLQVTSGTSGQFSGTVKASGTLGTKLLAALGVEATLAGQTGSSSQSAPVGKDISDLKFVADIIKESGQRLVVEHFHYLGVEERKKFAFDLMTLWDYGLFVLIVGVWTEQNLLLAMNPDLTGRVEEISVEWTRDELDRLIENGSSALNLKFGQAVKDKAISDCFENAGILQKLVLKTLDELGISEEQQQELSVGDLDAYQAAAMAYADSLNALYQRLAKRVSAGIRHRQDSTGIYARAFEAILDEPDEHLIKGVSINRIYEVAHEKEPRIFKANLHTILTRIEGLQIDEEGRGLAVGYNEVDREAYVIDRQLLLYRQYVTVNWPWEEIAEGAE